MDLTVFFRDEKVFGDTQGDFDRNACTKIAQACYDVIAKFHYTDPTRTGPDTDKVRAHCRRRAKFHYTDTDTDPTRTRRGQSPCTLSGTS